MKALAFVLFLVAMLTGLFAHAARPSTIAADTSSWKHGESQTFTLDGTVHVTIRRDGDVRRVTVMRLGMTNEYTVEPVDGVLQVTSRNLNRGVLISPHRIAVDGVSLEGEVRLPSTRSRALFYMCPKDRTVLAVPHSDHDGEFKCPVDGTPMRPSVAPGSPYFLLQ